MDARVELAAASGKAGCNAWVIGDETCKVLDFGGPPIG